MLHLPRGSLLHALGLRAGDRLVAINGRPLTDLGSALKIPHLLATNRRVTVQTVRAGMLRTLRFTVRAGGDRPLD